MFRSVVPKAALKPSPWAQRSGTTASALTLTREVVDGSWTEWSSRKDADIET